MTIQDFIKYYKNGHGRAVCALENIADKEPYRKAFLECIKETRGAYREEKYISNIAKNLFTKETQKEFAQLLFEILKTNNPLPINMLIVLQEYAPREEIVAFVEKEYEMAFNRYIQSDENDDRDLALRYYFTTVAVDLVSGCNDERLKDLIRDAARVYEVKKTMSQNPFNHIKFHHNGDEPIKKTFKEALKDNQFKEELYNIVFPEDEYQEPAPRTFKKAEDYLEFFRADFEEAFDNFCKADPNIVKELAEIAVSGKDERSNTAFTYFVQPKECNAPEFPLESKYLIEVIEKYRSLDSEEKAKPSLESTLSSQAMAVLDKIKGKEEKEYCLSVFRDESLSGLIRNRALSTVIPNYELSDGDLLRDYYNQSETSVLCILQELAKNKITEAPYDLCLDTYENSGMFERENAVETLAIAELLTDELINECLYDESDTIREIAIAKRNK